MLISLFRVAMKLPPNVRQHEISVPKPVGKSSGVGGGSISVNDLQNECGNTQQQEYASYGRQSGVCKRLSDRDKEQANDQQPNTDHLFQKK